MAVNLWLTIAATFAGVSDVFAATIDKTNNTANLNLASSWVGGGVPGSGDIAQWSGVVTGANTVSLGANLSWAGLRLTSPGGAVTLNSGSILTLGTNGVDLSAAMQDLTLNCALSFATNQTWSVAMNRAVTVGNSLSGTAQLTLPGPGAVNFAGTTYTFGTTAAGNKALALDGGTVNFSSGTLTLNSSGNNSDAAHINGNATFNLASGTVTSSFYTRLGSGASNTFSVLNVSGGTFNNSGEILFGFGGTGGNGTLTISGGTASAHFLRLGDSSTNGSHTVNLDGGTLKADRIFRNNATPVFNFNGGLLQVNANPSTPWFAASAANVFVKNGGAKIDTAGKSVTIEPGIQAFSGSSGGLAKLGAGTLTLAGTNSYAGATTISNGTLVVNGRLDGAAAVTVTSGATLGGTGVIAGAVSVLDGAMLQPGAGQLTVGNLTLSPTALLALTLDTATNAANSTLRVNGNLVLDGTVVINDFGGVSTGAVYSVINYTGALVNNGLIVDASSAWNVTVDTSLTNFVRVIATQKLPPVVRLYENLNYSGWTASLGDGDYTAAGLAALGVVDNALSSIKVPAGWGVTLYDGDNFTGTSVLLASDSTNLVTQSFENLTTSLRVRAPGDRGAVTSGNWSSPATWGGLVPGVEEDVGIPSGVTVTLDAPVEAGSITVRGVLRVARTNCSLIADVLTVTGTNALFEVGTEAAPFQQNFTLTLKGLDTEADSMMGAKVLGSMNSGVLQIHGQARTNWTRLGATALKNATSLTLATPVDWKAGEEIILASTDFEAHQAEQLTITSVSTNGLTVNFTPALSWMHFGALQTYTNANSKIFSLDERAEVGLLTHNVKIQGDAASDAAGLGGHIMVMNCPCGPLPGKGWIEGAELYRLGQKSLIARYPWHWHICGDVTGQYIRGCSIHKSFNRFVTVHDSDNALVEDNVGYDTIGHGYFLEDGSETGNTFRHNLGILTRLPVAGEEVRPHDRVFDGIDPTAGGASTGAFTLVKLPSLFWITNPSNNFIDNAAAGSEGSGFWMVNLAAPLGEPDAGMNMVPGRSKLGIFSGNSGHSCSFTCLGIDGSVDPVTQDFIGGHYHPRVDPAKINSLIVIPQITNFTAFKCRDRAVWFRADTMHIHDSALADNSRSTFFAYNQILFDSLIVGQSANIGNPTTVTEIAAGRSLPNPDVNAGFRGHSIYDGPSGIVRVHFAGFNGLDRALQINGAAQKSTVHFAEGITFAAGMNVTNKIDFSPANNRDYGYASGLIDRDGSISGIVGGRITPDMSTSASGRTMEDFNVTAAAIQFPAWTAWVTPTNEHYGLLRLDNKWPQYTSTPVYAIAYDATNSRAAWNIQTYDWYSQNPALVNSPRTYGFIYSKIANRFDVQLRFIDKSNYVIATFPNLKSSTYIYKNNTTTALPFATSYNNMLTNTTESCWFRDNTLAMKLIGTGGGYDAQFGNDFSAASGSIRVCQNVNGNDPTNRTDRATLADFEMGNDSRGSFLGTTSLVTSVISADSPGVTTGPFDTIDHKISWALKSNTNGLDDAVDYRLTFPRQLWTEFPALRLNYTGPDVELLIVDADNGPRSLGVFKASDSQQIHLADIVPANFQDNVTGLICRFRESGWVTNNTAVTTNVNLYGIELLAVATNTFSYSYSPDRDGDGILNINEPPGDIDQDGLANVDDRDSDGDGMDDGVELAAGRDPWSARDFAFHFDADGNFEGWGSPANIAGLTVTGGKLFGTTVTGDPQISRSGFTMPGSQIIHVIVKLRCATAGSVQLYWSRFGAAGFAQSRFASAAYTTPNQWQAVRIPVGALAEWTNQIITALRIDPISLGGQFFEIDWIRGSAGDLDGDGTPDSVELSQDSNGDGILDIEDPNAPFVTSNNSPTLAAISNRTLIAGQTLTFTNIATDTNVPAQTLTYSLLNNPPSGATITINGVFTWRPTIAQSPSTNIFSVMLADNGSPSLSATQNFSVTILKPAKPAISAPSISNGRFNFTITGDSGADYTVLASTNLTAWTSVWTTNSPSPPLIFSEPTTNLDRRFYRILLGP